jgi:glycopeptide antibiotics resistance protein
VKRRRVRIFLFIAYCLFLLWLTVLSRQPRVEGRVFKWQLLWSYRAWIAGEPYGKTESIQNINNILVFIPFGFFFPGKSLKVVAFTALAFSAVIEGIQIIANLGWCEVDDVICNTLGAVLGWFLWIGIKRMKEKVNAKT